MTEKHPPGVFISYSHDTVEHQERVVGLADRLRADGIDAEIDQYNAPPPEGWPLWCERQIATADIVLMVCTEIYHQRVRGDEKRGKGLGVVWEARLVRQLLYDAGAVSDKFVPVLFSDTSPDEIPSPIKSRTRYVVDTEEGYEELYRRLTGQPHLLRPALGAHPAEQSPLLTIRVQAPSGEVFEAQVPHDVTIAKLASDFSEDQGWTRRDKRQSVVVELVDLSNPDHTKRLSGALTFAEAGIRSGDTLRIFLESLAGCFLGDVPVTLSDGQEKPFRDVVVGDALLSFCSDTGRFLTTHVNHVYKGVAAHFFSINGACHVTETHPFWSNNQWKNVWQLAIGDKLRTVNGAFVPIKSVDFHNQRAIVYNLHLTSRNHTFFAGGFLVHNMALKAMPLDSSKFTRQKTQISVAYPRVLSKGRAAKFLFHIYPRRIDARAAIQARMEGNSMEEITDASQRRVGERITVSLHCPVVEFTPEEQTLRIENRLNKIAFIGIPRDSAAVAEHDALVTIVDTGTENAVESIEFKIRIVDYAFDHISRPLISKITSTVLACVSAGTFVLTSLKEIDSTLGLTAGTAVATLTAVTLGWGYLPFHTTRTVEGEISV